MTRKRRGWMRRLFRWRLLTPVGLVRTAIVLLLVFAVCHLAGLREHTSILCGTLPAGGPGAFGPISLACLYILLYFTAVLAVPVLLIGTLLFTLLNLALAKRRDVEVPPSSAVSS